MSCALSDAATRAAKWSNNIQSSLSKGILRPIKMTATQRQRVWHLLMQTICGSEKIGLRTNIREERST
eukprot:6341475-Amphidinium_carterae.1